MPVIQSYYICYAFFNELQRVRNLKPLLLQQIINATYIYETIFQISLICSFTNEGNSYDKFYGNYAISTGKNLPYA